MKVLVVGGAGYIGSHMLTQFSPDDELWVLDNFSTGYRDAITRGQLIEGDLGDRDLLDRLMSETPFDAVMHFAAYIEVGESVRDPAKYYQNNVMRTQVLLDAMVTHGIPSFVFSSTAAIFGEPQYTPIDEAHPHDPVNPYGRSKLMVEQMLEDYDRAYGLKSVCLRYFNAAGAAPDASLGERHNPETHLIPLVLQAASGRRSSISVFGEDYDTPDGSCVRDYIHILDLCDAHLRALDYLATEKRSARFNLGNGQGFSVKEVIDVVRQVTGKEFEVVMAERRPGDPAVLVADAKAAQSSLGWSPQYGDLDTMVAHAWAWEQKHFGAS